MKDRETAAERFGLSADFLKRCGVLPMLQSSIN